jgi:hypothetical protein
MIFNRPEQACGTQFGVDYHMLADVRGHAHELFEQCVRSWCPPHLEKAVTCRCHHRFVYTVEVRYDPLRADWPHQGQFSHFCAEDKGDRVSTKVNYDKEVIRKAKRKEVNEKIGVPIVENYDDGMETLTKEISDVGNVSNEDRDSSESSEV